MANVSCFLWCSQDNLESLTLNKNRYVIQTHYSTLELLFWVCFCTVVLYFSVCNKWISFEDQHICLSFFSLIFVSNEAKICLVRWFYCFSWSWISFRCLYLDNNRSILFFILWTKIKKFGWKLVVFYKESVSWLVLSYQPV